MFMTHYEVERRVGLNLKDRLPSDARLERVYGGVDTYFRFKPFLRVRDLKLTYPSPPRLIQRMGIKKIIEDGEIKEVETPVNASTALQILSETIGKPKVAVEVQREEYSLRGLTVCIDDVKNLGNWTEIEKISKSKEENANAIKEVVKTFKSIGVSEKQLTSDIYPVLLFNKQHKRGEQR